MTNSRSIAQERAVISYNVGSFECNFPLGTVLQGFMKSFFRYLRGSETVSDTGNCKVRHFAGILLIGGVTSLFSPSAYSSGDDIESRRQAILNGVWEDYQKESANREGLSGKNAFEGQDRINGETVYYQAWPRMESPWTKQGPRDPSPTILVPAKTHQSPR